MKEYAAVFEKTANGWSAYAPDLPGLGVAAATLRRPSNYFARGLNSTSERCAKMACLFQSASTQVMRMAIPA